MKLFCVTDGVKLMFNNNNNNNTTSMIFWYSVEYYSVIL